MAKRVIAIIGGGNLGGAFAAGYLRRGAQDYDLVVVEPDRAKHAAFSGARCVDDIAALGKGVALAIIAVKPQLVQQVCQQLGALEPEVVVSFAAGVRLDALRAALGAGPKLIRAMGNTAAAFGASITSLCAAPGEDVPPSLTADFAPLGDVIVLADEKQMDAAMALSGSAPAFVLAAAEGLSDGGVRLGLGRELADRMAIGAIRAAAAVGASEHMTVAKQRITSPGGTTIEGLAVIESAAVRAAFADAAVAAAKRAKELLG